MAFNIQGIPFKLGAEDVGVPNYAQKIAQSLQNVGGGMELGYKPSTLAQELLAKQLANKKTLMDMAAAQQEAQQQAQFNKLFQNALNQPSTSLPINNIPRSLKEPSNLMSMQPSFKGEGLLQPELLPQQATVQYQPTTMQSNEALPMSKENATQILYQGNPQLEKLNQLYDNYPQYRKFLEANGFTKKQELKYDAKTGRASIITTYPNGRVEISPSSGSEQNDLIPLTPSSATKLQGVTVAVDNAIPLLEQLTEFNTPSVWGSMFKGANKAKYDKLIATLTELMIGALNLPLSDKSAAMVKNEILSRRTNETDKEYHARMKDEIKELKERKARAKEALKAGISTAFDPRELSDTALSNITGEE